MAKKWNLKSWVKKLKSIKLRKKEEEAPFYLPSDDLKQSNGKSNKSKGLLDLPQSIFDTENRARVHQVFIGIMIILISWSTGKLSALFLTPYDLRGTPDKVPTVIADVTPANEWQSRSRLIRNKDLFQTAKPDQQQVAKGDKKEKNCYQAESKSSLPLKLENTVVLQDSVKSIASVQVRSDNKLREIREGEKIDDLAQIFKIERLRVNLKNLQSGECEYISHQKIEEENNLKSPTVFNKKKSKQIKEQLKEVEGIKQSGNKVCISRTLINEKMKNLGQILQDARAIQINNPDGSIAFKIVEITPGSIYSHLNIQNNDIIKSINGKAIASLNDIMGLFSKISNLPKLNLELERDGNQVPMKYEFTKNNPDQCKDADDV